MSTGLLGKDSELGKVEFITPETTPEDAARIREESQRKIDFLENAK